MLDYLLAVLRLITHDGTIRKMYRGKEILEFWDFAVRIMHGIRRLMSYVKTERDSTYFEADRSSLIVAVLDQCLIYLQPQS